MTSDIMELVNAMHAWSEFQKSSPAECLFSVPSSHDFFYIFVLMDGLFFHLDTLERPRVILRHNITFNHRLRVELFEITLEPLSVLMCVTSHHRLHRAQKLRCLEVARIEMR